jgi:predicted acyltransferase
MTTTAKSTRLLSLDAFRGATIAAMILVNNPGSWDVAYPQLRHAAWHGWTMTDMIFPFFLWIMGIAMTLSFAKRKEAGASSASLITHALRRSIIIFALGIIVNGFPFGVGAPFSWSTLRIPGVLQRIAICYLAATVIYLYSRVTAQVVWAAGLLIVYWAAMLFIPVPGYGAGVLNPVGNLCWYVDSHLLAGHTWIYAPAEGFDPEGILSTIPAVATTLLGVLTGSWLRSERQPEEKTAWMFVAALPLLIAALILDMWLPINKNLWSSSYVLLMGGWGLLCFGAFYWLIDVKKDGKWLLPFRIFGMNAIVLYVVSELLAITLDVVTIPGSDGHAVSVHGIVYSEVFASWLSPQNASLGYAILFVAVLFGLGWVMWKKQWFIRV